jgi:hypothetical protein
VARVGRRGDLPRARASRLPTHLGARGHGGGRRRASKRPARSNAKRADPRAFAAVVAAELNAAELAPELVALTQCPHPLVAAVARQAARKLGVPKARTGTLDEVAPFLWEGDRARLDAWIRA